MRDIYIALSGATTSWDHLSTVSNNLANAQTQGYRETRVAFELAGPPGSMGAQYAVTGKTSYSAEDGALQIDEDPNHLALRGDGFFALDDGTFTRDGSFQLDNDGKLVTSDGASVLADGGPIQLAPGESLSVASDGTVTGSKSGELGRISIVALSGASPLGGNRWSGTGGEMPESTSVVQGAVEGSNADTMRGMIEMMEASRYFEAEQKAIQASDEIRARLNRIGGS